MLSKPLASLHAVTSACLLLAAVPLVSQAQLLRVDGTANGDALGAAVAGGADVNDDGVPDVVVGSPDLINAGGLLTGAVTVYSGADGAILYRKFGDAAGDAFGEHVAIVGDINADGFFDFGAGTGLNGTTGYARVFSGVDGTEILAYASTEAGGFSGGVRIAAAGDNNIDGYDDVAVGAPGEMDTGRVVVFSGFDGSTLHDLLGTNAGEGFGSSVAGAGDVDGDGRDDFLVGVRSLIPVFPGAVQLRSGFDAGVIFEYSSLSGTSPVVVGTGIGGAVAGVGDLDLDGRFDFAIGEFDDSTGGLSAGRAMVLSGLDGSLMFDVFGTESFQALGLAVAGVGDVNGDGTPDVGIGAPGFGFSISPGDVFVHSGVDGSRLVTLTGTANSERFGTSVAPAGDVDLDGFFDVISGAPTFTTNLGPGSAVVHSGGFVGTPSRERIISVGCPLGIVRTPRIGFSDRAFINSNVNIELRGAPPGGSALLFFGFLSPAPLDILGLSGCILITTDVWGQLPVPVDANGQSTFALPFPNEPPMIGLGFVCQWIMPEPLSPFPLTLSFSDSLELVVGG